MMRLLTLDTNIISAIVKGDAELSRKAQNVLRQIVITNIVWAELEFGIQLASNRQKLQVLNSNFIRHFQVYSPDVDTANIWANKKAELRKAGLTIPDNDLWIAAIALHHDLTVVTRDKHFSYVPGLNVAGW